MSTTPSTTPPVDGAGDVVLDGEPNVQRFGHFLVLGTLGQGGMGMVLEAFDRTLDRRVAVKILHGDFSQSSKRRLVREAKALAQLSHPNVVQVYEVGEVQGQSFVAMELARGRTLDAWLGAEPPPSWRERLDAYLQAGEGLAAAHAQGLVHRDFKPANVLIDDEGHVRVVDFGLARRSIEGSASREDEAPLPSGENSVDARVTQAGERVGTPAYMSPEQRHGREVDARSDQFSFCISLYEALYSARPPSDDPSDPEGGRSPARARNERLRTPPSRLEEAIWRGMAADPDLRWPSMEALLTELRRIVEPKSHRRTVVGLSVALGLTVFGVGLSSYAEMDRCEGADAELAGIWDDARREQLGATMRSTALSYAEGTWAHVETTLDGYTEQWSTAYEEVCRSTDATLVQAESVRALKMACLANRRVALESAVDVLADTDEAPVRMRGAVALVESLPSIAICDDIDALRVEPPPPDDPELVTAVATSRVRLELARSLLESGDCEPAEAEAMAVVERAEQLAYGPLTGEAWLLAGKVRRCLGAYDEAEQQLERAFWLGVEHHHDRVELAASTALVDVVGNYLNHLDAAERWVDEARARVQRSHTSTSERVHFEINLGMVRSIAGRMDEAEEHYRNALARLEDDPDSDELDRALVFGHLGSLFGERGKNERSREYFERMLEIDERVLGPRHPTVGATLSNIGIILERQGAEADALRHHEQAVVILEEAVGAEHPSIGSIQHNIGDLLEGLDRHDEAREALERALAIKEKALGPLHPRVATTLNSLAMVAERTGQLDEARAHYRRALDILERSVGPDDPGNVYPLSNLADLEFSEGDVRLGREYAERAVALADHPAVPPSVTAKVRFVLAQMLGDLPHERARARTLAQQAYDGLPDGEPNNRAQIQRWLASLPTD